MVGQDNGGLALERLSNLLRKPWQRGQRRDPGNDIPKVLFLPDGESGQGPQDRQD
jgi:hypothetical protein